MNLFAFVALVLLGHFGSWLEFLSVAVQSLGIQSPRTYGPGAWSGKSPFTVSKKKDDQFSLRGEAQEQRRDRAKPEHPVKA